MASRNPDQDPEKLEIRQYYDAYYREGDFAHYPEEIDKAYFHAIFMYFSILPNASILDGGCGTGVRLARMERLGMKMTGIDLSMTGLQQRRNSLSGAALTQGDMLRMPFADDSFDAVITLGCSLMNKHESAIERDMLAEAMRVTRPNGWVIATTITDYSEKNQSGWYHRSRASLAELLHAIPARERRMVFTAPSIAARFPRLAMSGVASAFVKYVPRMKRTVVMGWRK